MLGTNLVIVTLDKAETVLIGEPGRTNYDWNFSLLGFSVRVHPAFLIMPLLLGQSFIGEGTNPGMALVVLTVVFFGSILFHELGHSLAFRYYGIDSYIVLYWMGGVACPTGSGFGKRRTYDEKAQIVVSLAGPIFNFLLGGLLIGIIYLAGGSVIYFQSGLFPMFVPALQGSVFAGNQAIWIFFAAGLFANLVWGLLNLIPVYPLDGGQVARAAFKMFDGHNGLRTSLTFSLIVAVVVALYGFRTGDQFIGIFFGFMAYSNYQMLQHGGGMGRGW